MNDHIQEQLVGIEQFVQSLDFLSHHLRAAALQTLLLPVRKVTAQVARGTCEFLKGQK